MGVALAALLIDNLPKIDAGMAGLKNIDYVLRKLAWMRSQRIWPNGLRYLWTDAFGLVLLVSLYGALNEEPYLDGAMELVAEVDRVLGRAAFVSGKSPTAMGSISTISPCGFMLSVCWGATSRPIATRELRSRVPSTGLSSCRAAVLSGK
jgi:hypothetical protein